MKITITRRPEDYAEFQNFITADIIKHAPKPRRHAIVRRMIFSLIVVVGWVAVQLWSSINWWSASGGAIVATLFTSLYILEMWVFPEAAIPDSGASTYLPAELELRESGLVVRTANSIAESSWSTASDVHETKSLILVRTSLRNGLAIPKRDLRDEAHVREVKQLVEQYVARVDESPWKPTICPESSFDFQPPEGT